MAGDRVNNYSQVDSNILELQLTTDKTFKGYHQLTLTNYDNTTVPAIAAGSAIECNGALYKFDTDESISTTDPVTSAAVADGTVYVCIVPDTTTATAAFTATAPTWSDSKQGWYGTGGQANYRYVEYLITLNSGSYNKGKLSTPFDDQNIIFLAYANGTQSNPGSSTNIYFDNVIVDKYSIYNSGTHTISLPLKPALYMAYANIYYSGSADQVFINSTASKASYIASKHSATIGELWSTGESSIPVQTRFNSGSSVGTIASTSYIKIKRISQII